MCERFAIAKALRRQHVGVALSECLKILIDVAAPGRPPHAGDEQCGQSPERISARQVSQFVREHCLSCSRITQGEHPGGQAQQADWHQRRAQPMRIGTELRLADIHAACQNGQLTLEFGMIGIGQTPRQQIQLPCLAQQADDLQQQPRQCSCSQQGNTKRGLRLAGLGLIAGCGD